MKGAILKSCILDKTLLKCTEFFRVFKAIWQHDFFFKLSSLFTLGPYHQPSPGQQIPAL